MLSKPLETYQVPLCGALVAVLSFFLVQDIPLLDWDTYARLLFIESYSTESADTHALYHHVLRMLCGAGLSPIVAVRALTALSTGTLASSVWWVALERGLSGRGRSALLLWMFAASPGALALILMAEDNVAYLPPLVLFLHWVTATPNPDETEKSGTAESGDVESETETTPEAEKAAGSPPPLFDRKRTMLAGLMLALALHFNITALIFFAGFPLALVGFLLGRRAHAKQFVGAMLAALASYYAIGAVLFPDSPIALHKYFVQATRLQDFGPDPLPLLSGERLDRYLGGARAFLLTPTTYRMELPSYLRFGLETIFPWILFLGYGVLLGGLFWTRRETLCTRRHFPYAAFGLAGITLLFPYFYEPSLIERWDMAWLMLLFGVIALIGSELRAGRELLFALLIFVQAFASFVLVRYHVSGAYRTRPELEMLEVAETLESAPAGRAIVDLGIDRHHLAYLNHRIPGTVWFLIGERDGRLECRALRHPLIEAPIPCSDLSSAPEGEYVSSNAQGAVEQLRGNVR